VIRVDDQRGVQRLCVQTRVVLRALPHLDLREAVLLHAAAQPAQVPVVDVYGDHAPARTDRFRQAHGEEAAAGADVRDVRARLQLQGREDVVDALPRLAPGFVLVDFGQKFPVPFILRYG
jgi:hypothetical protein